MKVGNFPLVAKTDWTEDHRIRWKDIRCITTSFW